MAKHDQGITHLGDDGVLRSFAPNGTVLEYVKLSANQIQQLVDSHGRNDHFTEVFDGVDGREVTDLEQLTNPGEHLLPLPFQNSTMSAGVTDCKYLQRSIYMKAVETFANEPNPSAAASSIQNQTLQRASTTNAPTSDNPMTGVSQALEGRGHPHGVDALVAATDALTINHDRVCQHITCGQHFHCYGMHPACSTCLYVDGSYGWGVCTP